MLVLLMTTVPLPLRLSWSQTLNLEELPSPRDPSVTSVTEPAGWGPGNTHLIPKTMEGGRIRMRAHVCQEFSQLAGSSGTPNSTYKN